MTRFGSVATPPPPHPSSNFAAQNHVTIFERTKAHQSSRSTRGRGTRRHLSGATAELRGGGGGGGDEAQKENVFDLRRKNSKANGARREVEDEPQTRSTRLRHVTDDHPSKYSRQDSDTGLQLNGIRLRSRADEIRVEKIRARVDDRPVEFDEKAPAVVVFKSPPFKAAARISLPALYDNESWTVGWIQACSSMKFRITYGTEGYSSWEFPQLKNQSMISDSDGRNMPWYGGNKEIATVVGPCKGTMVEVRMADSFAPRVTWVPPFYPQPLQERPDVESRLTRIHRDQSFYTWLAARNPTSGEMIVLATIKWRAFIDVAFDPKAPLGQRGTVIGNGLPKYQPEILRTNEPIPLCALSPPHANEAQVLVWRRHGCQNEEMLPSLKMNCRADETPRSFPKRLQDETKLKSRL